MSPVMTSKLLADVIVIRILDDTDFILLAQTSCTEESTACLPITSLDFLLRSALTSKTIRRGANWYPLALDLSSDDGSFLDTFIDMRAFSYFKIVLSQSNLTFSLSNWVASFAFLGTLMSYFIQPLLGAR